MMFFFQAEDGIRDGHVTGVQTCALPILGEMLDGYMATDGAADVTQTVLAWGAPYYTKLAMASTGGRAPDLAVMHARSEEHTSELQSRGHLVCRLLLEKKKTEQERISTLEQDTI